MAPHSSTLAWKSPRMEEPGGLQSMGSRRVRHDWATSLSLFTFMHWRRKWQPTPVFLLREFQGRGSLVGCHPWGRTESDTTEWLSSSSSSLCHIFYLYIVWVNIPNMDMPRAKNDFISHSNKRYILLVLKKDLLYQDNWCWKDYNYSTGCLSVFNAPSFLVAI